MRKTEGSKMDSFHDDMNEYRKQLAQGAIQRAYRGLMAYIMDLRTHFEKRYPDYAVSGSMYCGYMDMTYFSCIPASLKDRRLKIALVFVHEAFRFEVWLAGSNKQIQGQYWRLFRESGWNRYRIVPTTKGADSIVEYVVADNPDFSDLEALTRQIEGRTLEFTRDIESFLSEHQN
jgi:hypothetical protein